MSKLFWSTLLAELFSGPIIQCESKKNPLSKPFCGIFCPGERAVENYRGYCGNIFPCLHRFKSIYLNILLSPCRVTVYSQVSANEFFIPATSVNCVQLANITLDLELQYLVNIPYINAFSSKLSKTPILSQEFLEIYANINNPVSALNVRQSPKFSSLEGNRVEKPHGDVRF